ARSALMYAWSYISPFGPSIRTASSCAGSKNAAAKAWSNESCELKESVEGETFELLMCNFQSPPGDMAFFHRYPCRYPIEPTQILPWRKFLILLVGAPRFELGTPSPPDWCANRAALRSDRRRHYKFDPDQPQQVQYCGISRLSLAAVPP